MISSLFLALFTRAELQFDLFPGFGNTIRNGDWFPVTCEIFNDGPTFDGVIELQPQFGASSEVHRYQIELPSKTRKRVTFPVFATGYGDWKARLMEGQKKRANHDSLRVHSMDQAAFLMGAVSRTPSAGPVFPKTLFGNINDEYSPRVGHLQTDVFPDNPIALGGLGALYLVSSRAVQFSDAQAGAVRTWVLGGGHLILAIDQPGDINNTPWLRELAPATLDSVINIAAGPALHRWAENGPKAEDLSGFDVTNSYSNVDDSDPAFVNGSLPVAIGKVAGQVLLTHEGRPLMVAARHGLGRITLLTFNPGREPFKSWNNRPWFWSRLAGLEPAWFSEKNIRLYGRISVDGIFGAMLDSRQVQKLPVGWLLVLLAAYLLIIGPVDWLTLKRINRQMLTWLTFPVYVVLFSLLIYYIGYKLRAGQSEWNELHVVDALPTGQNAVLRGRTYASIYSPENRVYPVKTGLGIAAIRSEFQGRWSGVNDRFEVIRNMTETSARVRVPVWTSRLMAFDWVSSGKEAVQISVSNGDGSYAVSLRNPADRAVTQAWLVTGDKLYRLEGNLAAGQTGVLKTSPGESRLLADRVRDETQDYERVIQQRNQAFGDATGGRLDNLPESTLAAAFISHAVGGQDDLRKFRIARFSVPTGLDLAGHTARGGAVVLLWVEGHSPNPPMYQFEPNATVSHTMFRIPVEIKNATAEVSRQADFDL